MSLDKEKIEHKNLNDIGGWLISLDMPPDIASELTSKLNSEGYMTRSDLDRDPPNVDHLLAVKIPLRWANRLLTHLRVNVIPPYTKRPNLARVIFNTSDIPSKFFTESLKMALDLCGQLLNDPDLLNHYILHPQEANASKPQLTQDELSKVLSHFQHYPPKISLSNLGDFFGRSSDKNGPTIYINECGVVQASRDNGPAYFAKSIIHTCVIILHQLSHWKIRLLKKDTQIRIVWKYSNESVPDVEKNILGGFLVPSCLGKASDPPSYLSQTYHLVMEEGDYIVRDSWFVHIVKELVDGKQMTNTLLKFQKDDLVRNVPYAFKDVLEMRKGIKDKLENTASQLEKLLEVLGPLLDEDAEKAVETPPKVFPPAPEPVKPPVESKPKKKVPLKKGLDKSNEIEYVVQPSLVDLPKDVLVTATSPRSYRDNASPEAPLTKSKTHKSKDTSKDTKKGKKDDDFVEQLIKNVEEAKPTKPKRKKDTIKTVKIEKVPSSKKIKRDNDKGTDVAKSEKNDTTSHKKPHSKRHLTTTVVPPSPPQQNQKENIPPRADPTEAKSPRSSQQQQNKKTPEVKEKEDKVTKNNSLESIQVGLVMKRLDSFICTSEEKDAVTLAGIVKNRLMAYNAEVEKVENAKKATAPQVFEEMEGIVSRRQSILRSETDKKAEVPQKEKDIEVEEGLVKLRREEVILRKEEEKKTKSEVVEKVEEGIVKSRAEEYVRKVSVPTIENLPTPKNLGERKWAWKEPNSNSANPEAVANNTANNTVANNTIERHASRVKRSATMSSSPSTFHTPNSRAAEEYLRKINQPKNQPTKPVLEELKPAAGTQTKPTEEPTPVTKDLPKPAFPTSLTVPKMPQVASNQFTPVRLSQTSSSQNDDPPSLSISDRIQRYSSNLSSNQRLSQVHSQPPPQTPQSQSQLPPAKPAELVNPNREQWRQHLRRTRSQASGEVPDMEQSKPDPKGDYKLSVPVARPPAVAKEPAKPETAPAPHPTLLDSVSLPSETTRSITTRRTIQKEDSGTAFLRTGRRRLPSYYQDQKTDSPAAQQDPQPPPSKPSTPVRLDKSEVASPVTNDYENMDTKDLLAMLFAKLKNMESQIEDSKDEFNISHLLDEDSESVMTDLVDSVDEPSPGSGLYKFPSSLVGLSIEDIDRLTEDDLRGLTSSSIETEVAEVCHRSVTVLKYPNQAGGATLKVPDSIPELLRLGAQSLGLNPTKVAKVRSLDFEEIKDISQLADGDFVFLMTNLDEIRRRKNELY
eukprot:TRINITY_DN9349_c0_g1_i1.p1 TRINITY_DN9349_c0_g1~~TRINITY_DN9349_c0_g1_i1.p1  ORF type:complete len:1251 (-),score=340.45 TRINITY_DN9349_c0_g1_i1:563-4315(-)